MPAAFAPAIPLIFGGICARLCGQDGQPFLTDGPDDLNIFHKGRVRISANLSVELPASAIFDKWKYAELYLVSFYAVEGH